MNGMGALKFDRSYMKDMSWGIPIFFLSFM